MRRLLVEPLEDRSLLSVQPLVFGGIDDSVASPTNAGLTLAADLASGEQMPLFAYEAIRSEGISGIAFLPDGRLFGTTTDGPGSSSSLIEIDPATGVELSRVAISGGISIGDLAVRPGTSTLYAVRSDHDGADRGGEIYTLSTAGTATLVGGPVSDGEVGGLAFADADTLYYATTPAVNVRMLLELDADTLSVQSSKRLSGNEPLSGLAYWAEMDALVGSGGPDGSLVEIDPATGARSPIALQAPARGIWGDLDFQPDPETLRQIYHEDFEDGNGQYTPVNDHPRDLPGYWHFSLGRFRDQLLNHSVSHSWYYGQFETPTGGGNYPVLQSHKGVLISDQIELCDSGTSILSFSYLLDTRPALDVDIVEVYVEHNGGLTLIKDRAGGSLPRTGGDLWLTSTENISEFNGQTIRIHFLFDTGEAPPLDPEGWYVDDVQITCLEDVERSIEWEKRDAAGENLLLGGATFQITPNPYTGTGTLDVVDNGPYDQDDDDGQFLVTTATINDVVMYVLADDYEIKETVAPPGYAKDPDPRMVTVSDANPNAVVGTQGDVDKKQNEEDTNYDFFNVLYSIEWEKRDSAGENLLLGGATFQITPNPYTGTGTLDVVDNGPYDQDPDGGQFKVTKVTINDVVMYVLADDYEIKETVAPPGYAKDPDPRMVTVSDANPNAVVGTQGDVDKKQNEEDTNYDFFNVLYSIEWEKRDSAGENLLLGGATFQITPNPYTGTGTLDVVDNGPYDQDPDGGQFKVTKVTINDVVMYVLADDYEIKETVAPPGYAKDPDPRMVTVSDANPNAVVGTQGDVDKKQNEEDTNYDFFNVLYSIEWEKRDASGENLLLGGATFEITPNPYTGLGTLEVEDNGPYDQDADDGQFLVTTVTIADTVMYVLADDYEIKETVAPPGYAKDPDPRMVTVSDANPNAVVGEQDEIDQKENEEDQDYDFFNEPIEIAPPAQTVQFITPMSFWRSAGPFDPDTDGDTKPSTGTASIGGYLWNDNDQDGTWDAGERGRGGWLVFIDANDDGSLDPVTERFAVTEFDDPGTAANEAGRYELAGLAAGTYTVAVARTGLSDGTFRMLTFPDADPTTGRHTFEVELADGQTVQGDREQTELPNFGSFDYSPFIRPADDVLGHYQLYFGNAADQNRFVTALSGTETRPWQTFDVANNTGSNLNLDSIMVEVAAVTGASLSEFRQNIVSVFLMENGAIVGNELTANASGVIDLSSLSLTLEPGETQEFFVFYNPGFWDAAHASVSAQYPDWYDDPNTAEDESSTRPPHTFGNDDHLEVITSFDASSATPPSYRVDLVGGSTYDSDIFYDGLVVLDDYRLIDDVLRDNWPTVVGDSDFDPTKDINARFPNGAEDDKEPDPWPLAGPPAREIGLGDFGPFNVEHDLNAPQQGRARAPFLDLDPDNDSRVLGVNFQTQFSGEAVPVSDTDASFANAEVLLLQSLIVDVLDPQTGDVVSFPESLTRTVDTKIVVSFPAGTIGNAERLNTNIVVDQLSGPALTFQRDTSINSTTFPGELFSDSEVLVFIEVARNVLFDAASSAPERDVVVRFRSTGTDEDFGSQTDGNTAKTTVHIVPTSIAFENRTEGGELLGGATFTLEPDPATGSGSLEVVDDVDDVTSESDVDRDPRPGSVLVEPVEPGAYTITQTTAPAGYDLDDDVDRAIVVNSPGEAVVVGTQGADDPGNADTSDFHNPVTAEPVEAEMQAALAAIDMDPAIGFWATAAIQESASDGSRDSSPDGPDVPSATVEVDGAETTPEQALLESPAELELAIEEMLEDVDSVDVVFAELGAE